MKKILIIDDEERIRGLYSKLLKTEGFNVREASSASDANEILKQDNIDLVLLDIKMPEVDGGTFYEAMRLFHKKTKVIVTSVYSLGEQKEIITGAENYHDKSEGYEILVAKVKEALENEPS